MRHDLIDAAMATWAAKDLPARLYAAQVAKILNCSCDDIVVLVNAGKLRALGRPRSNGVKLFSTIELFTLMADRDWLDEATKSIGQHWRRKNERRNGSRSGQCAAGSQGARGEPGLAQQPGTVGHEPGGAIGQFPAAAGAGKPTAQTQRIPNPVPEFQSS